MDLLGRVPDGFQQRLGIQHSIRRRARQFMGILRTPGLGSRLAVEHPDPF